MYKNYWSKTSDGMCVVSRGIMSSNFADSVIPTLQRGKYKHYI